MTYEAALEALNDPRCANPLAAASRVRILIGEGIDGLKRQRTPECEALLRQIQKDLNR